MSDDNSKAIYEAEAVQLRSFIGKIMQGQREAALLKAPHDAKIAEVTELFRHAKTAGFQRKELTELIGKLNTKSKDLVEADRRMRRFSEALSLPSADSQMDMFGEAMPQEKQDEAHYAASGLMAGMRGADCKPQDFDVPARFHQIWMKRWGDGQSSIIEAMKTPAPAPPKPLLTKRASELAGFSVVQLDNKSWIVVTPADDELAKEHPTAESAWVEAEEHHAANPAKAPDDGFGGGETIQ